ncbi:MAG: hypothetical protein A3I26_00350 [Candidatus Yanofskybacteria bacterium RIFCSPLOWO2_02_FULL_43_10]|nr:MAG: hypothetical protein A3C69_03440 [Candidatus Yanofskybacteria bacterium RIFCSPHIGHO2_02_FULL_43_12]OGN30554.1 MAG: hypothetical protein A3I26_00350 [Candidatus Yanofskybacteria bacterium RIFCSPLOWO2_02_FULL_43_10]
MNRNKLKLLVIGLGSMGKRRIRNLIANGVKKDNIFGFNISKERCKTIGEEYGIKTSDDFKLAVKSFSPDVFMISTPPDTHDKYFLYAIKHKKHFFVEHPTTDKGYNKLLTKTPKGIVGVPSNSWRFNPSVKKIKELLEKGTIGKILAFQYHMGQYLPDWHPWEDFRNVYFSKKETGACREMFAFELGWLTFALNLSEVKNILGITKKLSDLDMSADDFYSAVLNFKNKVSATMVIDLLSRKPFRTLKIIGSKGVLEWEWLDYTIKIHKSRNDSQLIRLNKGRNEKLYVTTEDMYEEEIELFLEAVEGKRLFPFTFKENHHFLKVLFALEKSSKTGQVVSP